MSANTDPSAWGWFARSMFWFGQTVAATAALYVFWGLTLGEGRADLAVSVSVPLVSVFLLFRQVSRLVDAKLRTANSSAIERRERTPNGTGRTEG